MKSLLGMISQRGRRRVGLSNIFRMLIMHSIDLFKWAQSVRLGKIYVTHKIEALDAYEFEYTSD